MIVPPNEYLKQNEYDIFIREGDSTLNKFSTFTDVEWIATYYKPKPTNNTIFEYFMITMKLLIDHLNSLKTIRGCIMQYLDDDDNEYKDFTELNKTKQIYTIPGTSLVYYNTVILGNRNFDVTNDIAITPQTTMVCDVLYIYRVMIQLSSFDTVSKNIEILDRYKENKLISDILETIEESELFFIEYSYKVVKNMFNAYNSDPRNSNYLFDSSNDVQKLKAYFFLIFYKLINYMNVYISRKRKISTTMLKYALPFAVRHYNSDLYFKIKDLVKKIFLPKFQNRSNEEIDKIVVSIIQNIVSDDNTKEVYMYKNIQKEHNKLLNSILSNPNLKEVRFGDPLYSVSSYFQYFETQNLEHQPDWLVKNNIDEKSSKFDLTNDDIMFEFRSFYEHAFLYLFLTGNDEVRENLLQNQHLTFNMKTIKSYINFIGIQGTNKN